MFLFAEHRPRVSIRIEYEFTNSSRIILRSPLSEKRFTLGRARTWRQRYAKALCEDTWSRLFPPGCSRATVDRARRNCDSSRRKPILRRNDLRWDGHGRIWYRWCCRHRSQGKGRIDIRIQDCWSVSLKNNVICFFFFLIANSFSFKANRYIFLCGCFSEEKVSDDRCVWFLSIERKVLYK